MADEQKTPEQLEAELKLQAQAQEAADKKAAEEKAAAEKLLAEKKAAAGELHFVHEGEVYKPLIPAVFIPRIGKRTALEICADEEAQAYLVREGCVGTVIEKV